MDKRGFHIVTCEDGSTVKAWFNPDTGHWLDFGKNKQIGCDGFINNKMITSTLFWEK